MSVLAFVAASLIALLPLYFVNRALDVSDESFYLLMIAHPERFSMESGIRNFGFVYHPLYALFHSVTALRLLSALALAALFLFMGLLAGKFFFQEKQAVQRLVPAVGLLVSLTSLYYPFGWLPTPSYNTLSLQAFLLVMIGILGSSVWPAGRRNIAFFIVSIGLALEFLAKPQAGAALAFLVAVFFLVTEAPRNLRWLFIIPGGTVLVLSAYYLIVDHGFGAALSRFMASYRNVPLISAGSYPPVFRLDTIPGKNLFHLVLATNLLLFSFGMGRKLFNRKEAAFLLLMILAPAALVLGTQNNYWNQAGYYLGIELVAGFVLLSAVSTFAWISPGSVLAVSALVISLAHTGLSKPYLAPGPITQADVSLNIPGWGSVLVFPSQAEALTPLVNAIREKTEPADKLFDASGDLPIVSLLTDRSPSGAPWTLGGHTGFVGATVKELDAVSRSSCHGSSRLIVLSTGRPSDLRVRDVSQKFGLSYPSDFTQIFGTPRIVWQPLNLDSPLAVDLSSRPMNCPAKAE